MVSTMWRLVTGAVAALMCTVVLGMHMGQGDAITSGAELGEDIMEKLNSPEYLQELKILIIF